MGCAMARPRLRRLPAAPAKGAELLPNFSYNGLRGGCKNILLYRFRENQRVGEGKEPQIAAQRLRVSSAAASPCRAPMGAPNAKEHHQKVHRPRERDTQLSPSPRGRCPGQRTSPVP